MVRAGYKETEVGVIPEDWVVKPLENFTSFISYGFTNPMPTVDSGVYMITARDISNGKIQCSSARCTSEDAYRTLLSPKSKPRLHDILLTKDGTLGRLALVGNEKVCINQSVAIVRPNDKVRPLFLKMLLEAPYYQNRMLENAGGSTIKHIYITIVNHMLLGIPESTIEQQAIAEALSDVDGLIDGLTKLIAKKRDIKTATMQQLLTGKTRLPGFGEGKGSRQTELGEIPEDWDSLRIENAVKFVGGSQPPRSTFVFKPQKGYLRLIQIRDYKSDKDETYIPEEFARKKCDEHDVMIGRYGPPIFQILRGIQGAYNVALIKAIPNGKIDRSYLYYTLKGERLFTVMEGLSQRSSGQTGVELPALKKYPLSLPQIQEQQAIAKVLTDIDNELEFLHNRLNKTKALKQGMMQELLTGKTRLI